MTKTQSVKINKAKVFILTYELSDAEIVKTTKGSVMIFFEI